MSLLWLFLLDLLLSFATTSPDSQPRRTHLPPMKVSTFAQGTSRRIVQLYRVPPDKSAVRKTKIPYSDSLNSSNLEPHSRKYNMWQTLSIDGRFNFCVMFFTIYISYLIYVLF